MRVTHRCGLTLALVSTFAMACAGPGQTPASGRAAAWGYVTLVRPQGAAADRMGIAYGDGRLRDVERVDYSRPGFAVVYVAGVPVPSNGEPLRLSIEEGPVGPRLAPAYAATGVSVHIVAVNRTRAVRVLSSPSAGLVRKLEPGESIELALPGAGEHAFHLLGSAGASAIVFAAPGPFSLVSSTGRYELADLAPGHLLLHTWHPRFPPSTAWIDLAVGEVLRQDLELGLGVGASEREVEPDTDPESEMSHATH